MSVGLRERTLSREHGNEGGLLCGISGCMLQLGFAQDIPAWFDVLTATEKRGNMRTMQHHGRAVVGIYVQGRIQH